MPRQKELGESVIWDLSIKVVKTKDVQKMLLTAQKDQNMKVKGLSGITWNNSAVYTLDDESVRILFERIINKSEVAVKGKPDFIILKI